ncbi:MAG: hypothetical protein GY856_35625, partial [bacterium]|nr:hypothetical protein [bacterium]
MGGIGKSAFAAHLAECLVSGDRFLPLLLRGEITAGTLLDGLCDTVAGWRAAEADHQRRDFLDDLGQQLSAQANNAEARWKILRNGLFPRLAVVVLLDNFEDNLEGRPDRDTGGGGGPLQVRDRLLATTLGELVALNRTRLRVLVTSRFRVAWGDGQALPRGVEEHHLAPLSRQESRKLMLHLPALRVLEPARQKTAHRIAGGHPRALEYLDALLREGKDAVWGAVAPPLQEALEARVGQPVSEEVWDEALQRTVAETARDLFLETLLSRLADQQRRALESFAVYRLPVDRFGLEMVA